MFFRPLTRRLALLGCLGLIAACDLPAPSGGAGPAVDASGPVKVALLVPLGSGDAQREALAQSLVNAAELARGDLTGVTVELAVYPTGGDPTRAGAAAAEAVAAGADVILGPLFSTAAAAVAPVAAGAGIPVLSFSNNSQIAGGGVYILGNTFENTARRVVGYAASRGLTDIGVVHPQGVEGDQAATAVRNAAGAAGAQVVATGSYPLSIQGITDSVPGIARQMRGAGANAVVLTDGPTGGLTFVAETLRGVGLRSDAVRFVGLQRWDTSPQAMAQPALAGGWFAASDPALAALFENRYETAYGAPPHPLASLAYDGMAAIGALVSEARAEGRGDAFAAARLTKPSGFAGVGGVFRLLPGGGNERALAVFEIVDGAARAVDPAPRDFAVPGL